MTGFVNALAPTFLLIALGHLIRRAGILDEGFWVPAEKINYLIFFPALLVTNLAKTDLANLTVLPLAAALIAATLLVGSVLLVLCRRLGMEDAAFTSVLQGAIRFNTYVGIAGAAALFHEPGLVLSAVCIAVLVPLVNVISIVALVRLVPSEKSADWKALVGPVASNPLILACVLGAALNIGGIGLPRVIGPVLDILASAALPMGLIAVGAGIDMAILRVLRVEVVIAATAKLIILPLVTLLACKIFGVHGLTRTVAVLFASLPGSASSYVLARQMGGDAPLMAAVITVQTLLAALTMPLILGLLPR